MHQSWSVSQHRNIQGRGYRSFGSLDTGWLGTWETKFREHRRTNRSARRARRSPLSEPNEGRGVEGVNRVSRKPRDLIALARQARKSDKHAKAGGYTFSGRAQWPRELDWDKLFRNEDGERRSMTSSSGLCHCHLGTHPAQACGSPLSSPFRERVIMACNRDIR